MLRDHSKLLDLHLKKKVYKMEQVVVSHDILLQMALFEQQTRCFHFIFITLRHKKKLDYISHQKRTEQKKWKEIGS